MRSDTHQVWQRPALDILKLNIDGASSAASGSGGWGFVVRGSQADVRGSGAGRIQHVASAPQAEGVAYLEALHVASDWGMMKVQVETDCQTLVHVVESTEYDRAP